jgi:hypothetical protein
MGVIASFAVLFSWFRPITDDDAERIARTYLRRIPGVAERVASCGTACLHIDHAGRRYITVKFIDPKRGMTIAQVAIDRDDWTPVSSVFDGHE